jgi:hypothetical protein
MMGVTNGTGTAPIWNTRVNTRFLVEFVLLNL